MTRVGFQRHKKKITLRARLNDRVVSRTELDKTKKYWFSVLS